MANYIYWMHSLSIINNILIGLLIALGLLVISGILLGVVFMYMGKTENFERHD